MSWSLVLHALPIAAAIVFILMLLNIIQRGGSAGAIAAAGGRRNAWIDDVVSFLLIGGLTVPLALFRDGVDQIGWPALGLALGSAAVLPFVWVCATTLPAGAARFREYWSYHARRYRITLRTCTIVYGALSLFGTVSVLELFRRGVW